MAPFFRMPTPVNITGRSSTITNSFVNAIIPVVEPTEADILESLSVLGIDPESVCCAYCGDPATEWDHFRPIVENQRPTGYVSEIANLVPACGKCNQSKGGKPWRDWINGPAKRSPRTRNVNDLDSRISRLETYEGWRPAERVDFEAIVGPEMWDRHWVNWKKVLETMKESQLLATEIRSKVADRKKR